MIPQTEFSRYFSELASRGEGVARRLERGEVIQRNLGSFYQVDDPDIVRVLGEIRPSSIPYAQVRSVLASNPAEIERLFSTEGTQTPEGCFLNFSRIVEARLGQCVEKSALLQLAIQGSLESYFIMGLLKEDGRPNFDAHAFNIATVNGQFHVIDAENPVTDGEGKEYPYAAFIVGIDEQSKEIVVPENARFGRRYYF